MKTNHYISKYNLSYFLALVPIFIHIYLLNRFSLNFPVDDDHRMFMDFAVNYFKTESVSDKLRLLFSPENESIPVFTRIGFLASFLFTGALNFKFMLFFNNIIMVLFPYLFFVKYKNNSYFILIAIFLIFNGYV